MVRQYILLATGCVTAGVVITLLMLAVCQRLGVNIDENLWIVAIPAVLSLLLNVGILEIYQACRRKHN